MSKSTDKIYRNSTVPNKANKVVSKGIWGGVKHLQKAIKPTLLALFFLFTGIAGYANTYYYVSGSYTTASNWNTTAGGGGTAASVFTSSSDTWIIQSNLTLNSAWTVAGQVKVGDGTTTNTVTITTTGDHRNNNNMRRLNYRAC